MGSHCGKGTRYDATRKRDTSIKLMTHHTHHTHHMHTRTTEFPTATPHVVLMEGGGVKEGEAEKMWNVGYFFIGEREDISRVREKSSLR